MRCNRKIIGIFAAFMVISAVVAGIFIRINQNALTASPIDAHLAGTWQAKGALSFDSVTGEATKFADILIQIEADGSVTGSVGTAKIEGCRLTRNRTAVEAFFNLKTDYIISGGTLNGPIDADDGVLLRDITIPLNYDNDTLTGTLFHIEKMNYPDPIVSKLELTRIGVAGQ